MKANLKNKIESLKNSSKLSNQIKSKNTVVENSLSKVIRNKKEAEEFQIAYNSALQLARGK